jgi:hypothetical protein
MFVGNADMIAFEHGALQRHGGPLRAGILVHGVLETYASGQE